MHVSLDTQNLLRARNPHVIDELPPKVRESGTNGGAGEGCYPGAARPTVEIQAESGTETADGVGLRRQDLVDIRVAFEDGAEAVLDSDGEAEVGTVTFQDVECGSGEDAIAE